MPSNTHEVDDILRVFRAERAAGRSVDWQRLIVMVSRQDKEKKEKGDQSPSPNLLGGTKPMEMSLNAQQTKV